MPGGKTEPESASSGGGFSLAVGWAYIIGSSQQIVALVVSFTMARILVPEDFGVFALANLAQLFAGLVVRNGLTGAMIQRDQFGRVAQSTGFLLLFAVSLVTGSLMAVLAPLWSAAYGDPPNLTIVTQVMLLSLPVGAFGSMQGVMLRRDLRFKEMTPPVVFAVIAGGVVALLMAWAGAGIWALVGQQLTVTTVSALGQWRVAGWMPTTDFDRSIAQDLLGFTGGTLLATIAEFVRNRSDTIILGAVLGTVALGVFRFAARFAELAMEFAIRALQGAVLPGLARIQNDPERLGSRILQTYRVGAILAGFPILVVSVAIGPILEFVGVDKWGSSANAMRIIAFAALFQAIATLTAPTLQAVGRPYAFAGLAWIQATITISTLVPVCYAVRDWDLADQVAMVALVKGVIIAISMMIEMFVVSRICDLPRRACFGAVLPPLAVTGAAGGVAWLLSESLGLNVYVDAVLAGVVVGSALLGLVLFDRSARNILETLLPDRFILWR